MPEPKKTEKKKEAPAPQPAPVAASEPRDELPEDETPASDIVMTELTGLFVQKPESTHADIGSDKTFVAKVDSSALVKKPVMKWMKGKWMDLSSKAGKHFQFKETYDRNTKVYTYEMKIIKLSVGDSGGYRCEVTSKDKCDSCTFDLTVEAPQADSKANILETFKRSGVAKEDAGDLDFSALLKKREVKHEEPEKEEVDVWEILKNAKPSEFEKIAFQYGITDLRGMLKRLKKMKVEPKKSEAFTKKLDNAYTVDKGHKIKLCVEISNPDAALKWLKNGQEIKPSAKYVFEQVGLKRMLTINKCTLADDAAYECVIGEDKSYTEVFVKEPPVLITHLLDDQHVVVGDRVEFEVEVSEEGANVKWMKDGVELTREETFKYRFKKDGKKHWLIINEATKEDIGIYQVFTNGGESKAELMVEDKELKVLQSIADLTVKAAEQAIFKCEVSEEKVTGKWFKDGVEVKADKRFKMTHIGRIHKLVIDDVKPEDEGDYTFIPDGYALSLSAHLNFLEIKIDYVPRQDPPKIRLDTTGNVVSQNTIIVVAGNKMRLDVEITGEPAPTVTWSKGDKVITDTEGRVRIENRKDLSCFVIEGAEREDEGKYSIVVTNPAGEDKAVLFVKIVDIPDPPEAVKITAVGEDWATVIWEHPKYDGGQPVTGYLMERRKKGSLRWMKLNFEIHKETTFEATRMIEGVLYEMRVFAVNAIGVSQPSQISKPFMPIAPTSEPTHITVEDVTDSSTTLKWRPPDRIGAGGIDGYLIEYCKEGDTEWTVANKELVERTGFTVKGLPTGEKINFRVRAVNIAGMSVPALLGQPVTIREIVQYPKIRLPRHLRTTYVRKVGEKINLVIPFQGKPRPKVTWLKDGQPLDVKQVGIRTTEVDTILFIRSAERDHSGKYELSVQIENMVDKALLDIRIVEKPGPPIGVKITDVWGFNAAIEWKPPKNDGNSEIWATPSKKQTKKTMEWFTVYEHNRRTNCTVSDLIMGNEYYFRVFSNNVCGLSEEAACTKNTAVIQKTGLQYKPPEYKEKNIKISPKFTQPLVDRSVIAGYSAALSCSVKGYPKPKIIWMKNSMEIREDPKFLMQNNQGVLTLNIRKPSPYDGGRYTCKAVNDLGEDEVECKLEVRVPQ
ncbi:LOW QUALITY PROTEIN: myosin binding protein Ca [Erpetoichthys calabaricus]|uniref:LOW QUALITY PROTEIN: myosin binding protein Ca n=1 Tax=Erpetoichthys calabaricus TaxID=27687 RepID=UPI002234E4EE|nr:LOW QUALITY PROTEIN: myosin binding protein Ca [Erpetoichthys calabaricus]